MLRAGASHGFSGVRGLDEELLKEVYTPERLHKEVFDAAQDAEWPAEEDKTPPLISD
jgi:hypothetical protein